MSSTASRWSDSGQSEDTGEFDAVEVADAVAELSTKLVRLQKQIHTLRQNRGLSSPEASDEKELQNETPSTHQQAETYEEANGDIEAGENYTGSNQGSSAQSEKANRIWKTQRRSSERTKQQDSPPHYRQPRQIADSPAHQPETPNKLMRDVAVTARGPGDTTHIREIGTVAPPKEVSTVPNEQSKSKPKKIARPKVKRISRGVQSEQKSGSAPAGKYRVLLRLFRSRDNTNSKVGANAKGTPSTPIESEKATNDPNQAKRTPSRSDDAERVVHTRERRKRNNSPSVNQKSPLIRPKAVSSQTSTGGGSDISATSRRSNPSGSSRSQRNGSDDDRVAVNRKRVGFRKRPRDGAITGDNPSASRRQPDRRHGVGRDKGSTTSIEDNDRKSLKKNWRRKKSTTMNHSPQYIEDDLSSNFSGKSQRSDVMVKKDESRNRKNKKSSHIDMGKMEKPSKKNNDEQSTKKSSRKTASKSEKKVSQPKPVKSKTRVLWRDKKSEGKYDTKQKMRKVGSKLDKSSKKNKGTRRQSGASSNSSEENSSRNSHGKVKKFNLRKPKTETVSTQIQNQTILSSVRQKFKKLTSKNEEDPKKSGSLKSLKSKTSQNGKKKVEMKKGAPKLNNTQVKKKPKENVKRRENSGSSFKEKLNKFSNDREYSALKKRLTYCAVELNELVMKVSDLFHKKRMKNQ
ncbi:hypothetical protein QAD02_017094 [Eretmocerus hayati]|uniref:Uncharacterized protein n=1 Tax=Eretmocerus hayati TaxID=131215 RepID=A0ACC2PDB2_9HYME|nr:hypothetical protein QAD02_017094 [Eretmocerus hayati]